MPTIDTERGKYIYINDFTGGYDQLLDPTKIAENSFQVFENLVLYSPGSILNAVKRKGLERYNSNALTAGTNLLSIFEYINNKTGNAYLISKSDTRLNRCVTTGTFTDLVDSVNNDEASATKKVKMITFNDNCYVFDRNDGTTWLANKIVREISSGTFVYQDSGLQPPPQVFSISELVAGARNPISTTGDYYYMVSFVYDDDSESFIIPNSKWSAGADAPSTMMELLNPIGSNFAFPHKNHTNASAVLQLSNIPVGNSRVMKRKIYRAYGSVDTQFYYLTTIPDNTTTVLIDDKEPTDLTIVCNLQWIPKPLTARYVTTHKDRLFIGNLRERIYEPAPVVTSTTVTGSTGGSLTTDGSGARSNIYSYKFYNIYLIPTLETSTGNPYQGFVGKPSSTVRHANSDASYNKNTIAVIDNSNKWARKVYIERNVCQFVLGITIAGGVATITTDPTCFANGDSVYISDIEGFTPVIPDALYTVSNITPTGFDINLSKPTTGTWVTNTGVIEGQIFYPLGVTATDGTVYVDTLQDSYVAEMSGILELNRIEKLTEEHILKSTLEWSDPNSGDYFPSDNSVEVNAKDNDEITGLACVDNGVIIFKDRNIYKLYTTGTAWEVLKIISGTGCSDGYSIVTIDDNTIMFYGNNKFWLWENAGSEGSKPVECSGKINTVINTYTLSEIIGTRYNYQNKNWVVWTVKLASGSNGYILIYDLDMQKWYTFNYVLATVNLTYPLATKGGALLFGAYTDPKIYYYGSNNQDTLVTTATQISIVLRTREYDFNQCEVKALFAKIKSSGTGTVNARCYANNSGSEIGTLYYKTLASGIQKIKVPCDIKGDYVSLYLSNSDNLAIEILELGLLINPLHKEAVYVS